jgi:hypothetical protein
VSGITQSTALWYASRATGVVCLVLLTVVVLLGILVNRQGRACRGSPSPDCTAASRCSPWPSWPCT